VLDDAKPYSCFVSDANANRCDTCIHGVEKNGIDGASSDQEAFLQKAADAVDPTWRASSAADPDADVA
jgi:hypothetical protein